MRWSQKPARRRRPKLIGRSRQRGTPIAVERKAALADIKVEVANLSLDIAEQVLRRQLDRPAVQAELVDRLIEESPLN